MNNNKGPPKWTPAEIQANPKLYLQQIPNVLRNDPSYASAALLGLSSSSLPVHDSFYYRHRGGDPSRAAVVAEIEKKCPNVFKVNPTLFRKLVMESDATTINLLFSGVPLLISTVSMDLELALLAIQKAPLCYLHLPSSLLMNCSDEDKKKLESVFHKELVASDKDTIDLLLTGSPPMISRVEWNRELALQAVRETPRLYDHLPVTLKSDDTELALTAILNPKADVKNIVSQVHSCCNDLFSDQTVMKELFQKGGKELIMTLLQKCSDKIVWDQDLVEVARNQYPASYSFLPASFRRDAIDAQRAMSSLLNVRHHSSNTEAVHDAFSAVPEFFADQDAVEQLFLMAESDVVEEVLKILSTKLPWDKELARLAVKRVNDGEYSRDNLDDDEITRIYKGNHECRYHLPLGMLISYVVSEATDADEWPDFFNKCWCHLAGDDSALLEALEFVGPMLEDVDISSDVTEWAEALVGRFTKDLFESRDTLQSLLRCIHVTDSSEPLACLKGDDETSIALKRNIAEFLGAIGDGGTERMKLKQDALILVFCLITLPDEFPNEGLDTSDFLEYEGDIRGEDTFYCEWCCRTLAKLDKEYNGKNINLEDDDKDNHHDLDMSEDNHDEDSNDDGQEDD